MAKYLVGKMIAVTRQKLGISQETLADGICAVSSLSRIENGTQIPSYKVCGALMERLGMPKTADLYVSEEEMRRSNLERQITSSLSRAEYDISDLLEKYRSGKKEMNLLERQFYLYTYGIMVKKKEHDLEKALDLYQQALKISIPNFSVEWANKTSLLTLDEITIINDIANVLYELGDRSNAKKYMFYLKDYLENAVIDEEEKAKKYPMILFNLSNWLEAEGRYQDMIDICEKGIDCCIVNKKLTAFPNLILNLAYALAKTGQRESAESYMKQAYYGFCAIKQGGIAQKIKEEAYDLFHITI